ncbi:uncharacterized protein LOC144578662 isoform X2 [Callithrix jacchus]
MGDGGVVSRSMEVYSQEDYDCLCCVMQVVRKVKENQQLQASPSSYAKGVSYETIQKGWLKTPGSPSLVSGRQTFLRSESSLAFRSSPEITRCQSAILGQQAGSGLPELLLNILLQLFQCLTREPAGQMGPASPQSWTTVGGFAIIKLT